MRYTLCTRSWGRLLESVYSICLAHELRKRGLKVDREVKLPIIYDDIRLESAYRLDLLVESCIVIEAKAVEKLIPLFESQLLTYLKLSGHPLGFLVNFNIPLIKDGLTQLRQLKAINIFLGGGIGVGASGCGGGFANRDVVKTKLPSGLW